MQGQDVRGTEQGGRRDADLADRGDAPRAMRWRCKTAGARRSRHSATSGGKIVVFEITPEQAWTWRTGSRPCDLDQRVERRRTSSRRQLFIHGVVSAAHRHLRSSTDLAGESAMTTTSKFVSGRLEFFDTATFERVLPVAPVVFYQDFLGAGYEAIPAAGRRRGRRFRGEDRRCRPADRRLRRQCDRRSGRLHPDRDQRERGRRRCTWTTTSAWT